MGLPVKEKSYEPGTLISSVAIEGQGLSGPNLEGLSVGGRSAGAGKICPDGG